ncbi:hypothetical protein jaqu_02000 [Jannaschia aquimarina]|uniref:Uncharacterized protein n=1 Tax=Jannaschia aquimarina TaxID=935700 RepID=A0A0D1ER11_9RHOB|nr:hypothetical protein jaqu_02000 [Jannaschia aquimarina]SNS89846.1 hypothetical protein SAMN05421775_103226 [Jannaschia aquimarina]
MIWRSCSATSNARSRSISAARIACSRVTRGLRFRHRILAALGQFSLLRGLKRLDLADLLDHRRLFVAFDLQAALCGLHGSLLHRDLRIGVDLGAFLLGTDDHLGQLTHPNRVEGVVLVECLEWRLVRGGQ